jgi:hypothetical protein
MELAAGSTGLTTSLSPLSIRLAGPIYYGYNGQQ